MPGWRAPPGTRNREPKNHDGQRVTISSSALTFGGSDAAALSWEFLAQPLVDLAATSFRRSSCTFTSGWRLSIQEKMAPQVAPDVGVHPGLQFQNGRIDFAADFEQSTGSLGAGLGANALANAIPNAIQG